MDEDKMNKTVFDGKKAFQSLPDIRSIYDEEKRKPENNFGSSHNILQAPKTAVSMPIMTDKLIIVKDEDEYIYICADLAKLDFMEFIKIPEGLRMMHYFCKNNIRCEELLDFEKEIHHYKTKFKNESLKQKSKKANEIIDIYIRQDSKKCVNIFGSVSARIITKVSAKKSDMTKDVDLLQQMTDESWITLFDEAYKDVLNTLEFDTYPRFCKWVRENAKPLMESPHKQAVTDQIKMFHQSGESNSGGSGRSGSSFGSSSSGTFSSRGSVRNALLKPFRSISRSMSRKSSDAK